MSRITEYNDEIRDYFSSIEGLKKVYLQPPSTEKLVYPCLIITQDVPNAMYADDKIYRLYPSFELLLIDYDMESDLPSKLISMCYGNYYIKPGRYYVADNLCHWSYSLSFSKSII